MILDIVESIPDSKVRYINDIERHKRIDIRIIEIGRAAGTYPKSLS